MATKKTAVTTEETSKKETAKAETPVTEKTEKPAAKKTAAKKTTAKKEAAPKKTTAKKTTAARKTAAEACVILQFGGREFNDKDLIARVKEIWTKDLEKAESDLKDIKVYVKPDELMAYYVINNDEVSGSIEL